MTFYNRYRRRKIKPYLKSEPVPDQAEEEGAVVKVVGDNFEDVVMNKRQDVLVKYYAPWCGHCKKLAPIWDELAETLSMVDNLVIAKMDSTANEVESVSVQSYPTLIFYPANKKGKPITHEGGRTHDELLEWL
jgi:protein disulfide isomerase